MQFGCFVDLAFPQTNIVFLALYCKSRIKSLGHTHFPPVSWAWLCLLLQMHLWKAHLLDSCFVVVCLPPVSSQADLSYFKKLLFNQRHIFLKKIWAPTHRRRDLIGPILATVFIPVLICWQDTDSLHCVSYGAWRRSSLCEFSVSASNASLNDGGTST